MVRFIGLDLAWGQRNPSGFAVIDQQGHILGVDSLQSDGDILDRVHRESVDGSILAIDAPLVVSNEQGSRLCDRELATKLGKYKAAPYSVNRRLIEKQCGCIRGELLVDALGPQWHLGIELKFGRREVIEVYPHACQVQMFGLDERIAYKKGSLDKRRKGLSLLVYYARALRLFTPALQIHEATFIFSDLAVMPGRVLKDFEDKLDALICAYMALYWWRWGLERNEVVGDVASGFIVIPQRIENPTNAS